EIFSSALARTTPCCTDWLVTELVAWAREIPGSNVRNCCVARKRAWPAAGESKPCNPGGMPGFMVDGGVETAGPISGLPATDKSGGNNAPLLNAGLILSATLPAHPAFARPFSCVVCH